MKKQFRILLALVLVFSIVLAPFANVVVNAEGEKTVEFVFAPDEADLDKDWIAHVWHSDGKSDKIYDVPLEDKDGSGILTGSSPIDEGGQIGFVIYYGDWIKELAGDRFADIPYAKSEIAVSHGKEGVRVTDAEVGDWMVKQDISDNIYWLQTISSGFSGDELDAIDDFLNRLQGQLNNFNRKQALVLLRDIENAGFLYDNESQIIVHYKKAEEHQDYEFDIWTWWDGNTGTAYPFTDTDDYGEKAVIKVDKKLDKMGLKIRSAAGTDEPWTLESEGDINVDLVDGKAEIWIEGLSSDFSTVKPGEDPEEPDEPIEPDDPDEGEDPTSVEILVHYIRPGQDYEGWNVWSWLPNEAGQEFEFDEDHTALVSHEDPKGISEVGIIVRKSEEGNDWAAKNTPDDLIINDFDEDGKAEIWIVQNDPAIYTSLEEIPTLFTDAKIIADNQIQATVSMDTDAEEAAGIVVEGYEVESIEVDPEDKTRIVITTTSDLERDQDIVISHPTFGSFTIPLLKDYLHTDEFNEKYYYDGELGALYTPEKTTFRFWSPLAESVQVIDYNNNEVLGDMELVEDGRVWEYTYEGDANLMKYRYRIVFEDGSMIETVDPYARSASANGVHGVVVDSDNVRPDNFTTQRMPAFGNNTEAFIYEIHVRDYTIGPSNGIENKGKFLGLTEANTRTNKGNLSGLDYLQSLGVTHVQLLPIYDFASIDETGDLGYNQAFNWGYDPQNFNVPEGSYSTNPHDPEARIKELKSLIQAIHDRGMYVIMDVVYNHVFDVENSPLHKSVPGYYFRYDSEGKLHNGTGVGNETASEQLMYRKFMIDSLTYWAEEYNIDGFRFDLMGIHDVETMKQVRSALDEVDPNILILGEGWKMGNHPEGYIPSDQYHAEYLPRFAFFNDSFRDAIKGSVFDAQDPGYVSGANSQEMARKVYNSLMSQFDLPYVNPQQNVLYNEAHDNLTMYDKLVASTGADEAKLRRMHTHATTLQMLGNGMVFVHGGQEFLRTKDGDSNSYISPDEINAIDYDRAEEYAKEVKYFKDLVKLRKAEPLFRMNSFDEINRVASEIEGKITGDMIAYELKDGDKHYIVVSNASDEDIDFELEKGDYQLILSNIELVNMPDVPVDEKDILEGIDEIKVYNNSVTVLRKLATEETIEEEEETEVDPEEKDEKPGKDDKETINVSEKEDPKDGKSPFTGDPVKTSIVILALAALVFLGLTTRRRREKI